MAKEDMLVMSREELKRLEVIKKVIGKELKQRKAGELLAQLPQLFYKGRR